MEENPYYYCDNCLHRCWHCGFEEIASYGCLIDA